MIKIWRRKWFLKKRSIKRSLRHTRIYSVLGKRVFHPKLWKSDKRSIAGGFSLGLFVAFTPPIPFQMLVAGLGAIFFKVNLPLALAACWVTNPITAVPIVVAERELGKHLLHFHPQIEQYVAMFLPAGKMGVLIREGMYLASGSLIFSLLAAATGYLSVQGLWKIVEHRDSIKRLFRPPRP